MCDSKIHDSTTFIDTSLVILLPVDYYYFIMLFLLLQSPTQAIGSSPGYVFAAMHSPELMYAQPPPHAYQPELADATVLEGTPVEVIPGTPYTL